MRISSVALVASMIFLELKPWIIERVIYDESLESSGWKTSNDLEIETIIDMRGKIESENDLITIR